MVSNCALDPAVDPGAFYVLDARPKGRFVYSCYQVLYHFLTAEST